MAINSALTAAEALISSGFQQVGGAVQSLSPNGSDDMLGAMVASEQGKMAVQAGAALEQVANQMTGSVIDMLA